MEDKRKYTKEELAEILEQLGISGVYADGINAFVSDEDGFEYSVWKVDAADGPYVLKLAKGLEAEDIGGKINLPALLLGISDGIGRRVGVVMVVAVLMQCLVVGDHMDMRMVHHGNSAGLHHLHLQLTTASLDGFESTLVNARLFGSVDCLGDGLAVDNKADSDLRGIERLEVGQAREMRRHL